MAETTTQAIAPTTTSDVPALGSGEAFAAAWQAMVAQVPDAGGDGSAIIAQIAAAQSPDALNDPWEGEPLDLETMLGLTLRFERIAKAPSDFQDGLGFYLLVDAVRGDTGEYVRLTTGSTNVVPQLVRAYVMGWLPRWATVEQSKKATTRGFFPQHLHFVSDAEAATILNGGD